MPIGNLTSQLFANVYLNELDQFCKHNLKIHYYIRYMDDIIIMGKNKGEVNRWKAKIGEFLQDELHLDMNHKTCIRPAMKGVEFVGVMIKPTHIKIRKSTVSRKKREVRAISAKYATGGMSQEEFRRRVDSIRGSIKHVKNEQLRKRLNMIYCKEIQKAKERREMSNLQIIAELEAIVEKQAGIITLLATRLAELGDVETGRDEIAEADKIYTALLGREEIPDFLLEGV